MKLRRTILLAIACLSIAAIFALWHHQRGDLKAILSGSPVAFFEASAASDPTPNFSLKPSIHKVGNLLNIEKTEFFHSKSPLAAPVYTSDASGVISIHIASDSNSLNFVSTKCEFVRVVRISIPISAIAAATNLNLINHDTGEQYLLADQAALKSLLQQPVSGPQWQSALSQQGGGCGA